MNQFTPIWTDEDKTKVARLAALGMTSGEMMEHFKGRSRSSICGLCHRMGLKLPGQNGGNTNRKGSRKSVSIADNRYKNVRGGKPRAGNVIPMKPRPPKPEPKPVRPEYKAPAPAPLRKKPAKITVVSNNVETMVSDWLALNGGPRRFERGVTSSKEWIRDYLSRHGYAFDVWKNKPRINGRVVGWPRVHDIVDGLRTSEGLQPLKARA